MTTHNFVITNEDLIVEDLIDKEIRIGKRLFKVSFVEDDLPQIYYYLNEVVK